MMTAPKQQQVSGYRINACRSTRLQMAKTLLQSVIAILRSQVATAGRKRRTTSCNRAIVPAKGKSTLRVMESIATRVIGPHRASRGPTTAGPTRPVQNGSHRKAPTPRRRMSQRWPWWLPAARAARPSAGQNTGGGVLALCEKSCRHTPPWRASNAARGEFCDQPTERREPPPPLFGRPVRRTGVGCSLPSLTSRGN